MLISSKDSIGSRSGDARQEQRPHRPGPEGKTCWVISDGRAGIENQALGLAEALPVHLQVKRVRPRAPWRYLPARLWASPFKALGPESDRLAPPWPDLAIGCGRMAVPLTMAIRRASGGRCFTVQLQHPRVPVERFDLVVPPRHDHLAGPNVIATRGALHRVTPERLAEAAAKFAPAVAHLPRPLAAVLIGGSNRCYELTPAITARLAEQLTALAARDGIGLLVTASRRTGVENQRILRERLAGTPALVWDGAGENPYFAFLGLSEFVIVTCDSVAMVSEACSTGKPVHVVDLEGGTRKFREFHEGLRADGMTRPFQGKLERWSYAPLDDRSRVAAEIRRRMDF